MTSAPSSTPLPGARHPRDTSGLSTPLKTPHTLTDDQQVVEVEPNISSGVGVLDKAALILSCLEAGPVTLGQLVKATGLARPTAHRLAVALSHHRMVARDVQGRFMLGPRLMELANAAGADHLLASAERPVGLHDSIPIGTQLSMKAGSAAQVLLAWEDQNRLVEGLQDAYFSAAMLASVRRLGWAQSAGERERGTASVSAPVRSPSGKVIAAVSISGPIERLGMQPGRKYAEVVVDAAHKISQALRNV